MYTNYNEHRDEDASRTKTKEKIAKKMEKKVNQNNKQKYAKMGVYKKLEDEMSVIL